ncbi:MAG: SRPBCC family protein [Desulfofustis sp.]|nr:SRPBCC family protein [Desulfofustis sp.]
MHLLKQQQFLPVPVETVWELIQNPANLDSITPPDLQFSIVSPVPPVMYNGLIIEYRLRVPYFGHQSWVTEIKHIRPGCSFVDEQRLGPYRLWYHCHELQPENGGTMMIDRVHYQLPYGPLGELLHRLVVRRTLERIFAYRRRVLDRRYQP